MRILVAALFVPCARPVIGGSAWLNVEAAFGTGKSRVMSQHTLAGLAGPWRGSGYGVNLSLADNMVVLFGGGQVGDVW